MGDVKDKTWDEKYKPTTRSEIVGQAHIRARIENWVRRGRIPHLMFLGPAGVGKTSTARALAQDLFGNTWRSNLYERNASSSRGIDFIRNDIQSLVISVPTGGAVYHIIFLDEADELTKEAQAALKEIMMRHTDTAKFIFACNQPHKIIDPIKDRCSILRFAPLKNDIIINRLKYVCEKEGVSYEDGTLEFIADHSKGSLRKAIQGIEENVDVNNFLSYQLVTSGRMLKEAEDIKALLNKAFSNEIEGYTVQLMTLHAEGGYGSDELLMLILDEIDKMKIDLNIKRELIWHLAQCDERIALGSNEMLQLRCMLGIFHQIVTKQPIH